MNHVMLDLETMGLRPNAAIVSLGAAHFDAENVLHTFHTPISLQSCLDNGLVTDQSTVDWWMKQSAEARSSWQRDDAPTLSDALSQFGAWLREFATLKTMVPWSNGADFDIVLMSSAHRALGADAPWMYYNQRCYRTVRNMFPVAEMPRQGVHHNALDDALHQVRVLQLILKTHGLKL